MRHKVKGRKLNRTQAHRKAMLANMAMSLFESGRIITTLPKAKALRPYVERIITASKKNTVASRRNVLKKIHRKKYVNKLFDEIRPRYETRPGGYTRIIKHPGYRIGDGTRKAIIELV